MRSDLVLDALEPAVYDRQNDGGLVCHSDRGTQCLSIRYSERLAEAGIEPSVGSVGDSYDNALAKRAVRSSRSQRADHHQQARYQWNAWW